MGAKLLVIPIMKSVLFSVIYVSLCDMYQKCKYSFVAHCAPLPHCEMPILPHCEMPILSHILELYIIALTYGVAKPRKPRLPANFHYFILTAQYANQLTD